MRNNGPLFIEIPTPCNEDWASMTPAAQGRHCAHCNAVVVDFTVMTDAQLYRFLAQAQAPVCGRMAAQQLNRPVSVPRQPRSRLSRMAMAAGFSLLFAPMPHTAMARSRPPMQQQMNRAVPDSVAATPAVNGRIAGHVCDEKKEPLVAATVTCTQGGQIKAEIVTDFDGDYIIPGLEPGSYDLTFRSLGHESITVAGVIVTDGGTPLNMTMKMRHPLFGILGTLRYTFPICDPWQPDKKTIHGEELHHRPGW